MSVKFAIGAVALAVALLNGQQIGRIVFGESGVEIHLLGSDKAVTPEEVRDGQDRLEARSAEARSEAQEQAAAVGPPAVEVDLTGVWTNESAPDELSYTIEQFGSFVGLTEVSPWGVTAEGYGFIEGDDILIQFAAVDGSQGSASFTVVDVNRLEGAFDNATWGATGAVLVR